MELVVDLEKLKQLVNEKSEENKSFRVFLEGQDAKDVDKIVQRLYIEINPKIDCVECGYCCHHLRPVASDEELLKYVEPENLEKFRYAEGIVCKNLDGNFCTIYANRHFECRAFPYLDRDDFIKRIIGVLNNYQICPIVYNVVEELKVELGFEYK